MNAIELARKFQSDFDNLVDGALRSGAPISAVLMTLEDRVFELRVNKLSFQQEMRAREMQSKIVPANGVLPKHPN